MSFGIRTNFIKTKISKKILLLVVGVLIVSTLVTVVLVLKNTSNIPSEQSVETSAEIVVDYAVFWDAEDYLNVYNKSVLTLNGNPLDHEALIFNGFSAFYLAVSQDEFEQKNRFLHESILSLRKALVVEPFRKNADVYYILGKAYYQLGYFFQTESLTHLKKTVDLGYHSYDVFEYLGLIEASFSRFESAAQYFKKSIQLNNRDLVNLALANTYDMSSNIDGALQVVADVIKVSKDKIALEKAYVKKADLLIKKKQYDDALEACNKAIEINSSSADAYFFLGEIFSSKGDTVKARAQWRQAFVLDSKHTGAISRLNS